MYHNLLYLTNYDIYIFYKDNNVIITSRYITVYKCYKNYNIWQSMKLDMCTNWPSKALTLEENIKLKSTLLYSPILFIKENLRISIYACIACSYIYANRDIIQCIGSLYLQWLTIIEKVHIIVFQNSFIEIDKVYNLLEQK